MELVTFVDYLLIPSSVNTWEGSELDDVHAEPFDTASFGIDLIIDIPLRNGNVKLIFPGTLFIVLPLIIVSGYLVNILDVNLVVNVLVLLLMYWCCC